MLRRRDEAQLSRIASRLFDQFLVRQVVKLAGGADLAPVNDETEQLGLAHRGLARGSGLATLEGELPGYFQFIH